MTVVYMLLNCQSFVIVTVTDLLRRLSLSHSVLDMEWHFCSQYVCCLEVYSCCSSRHPFRGTFAVESNLWVVTDSATIFGKWVVTNSARNTAAFKLRTLILTVLPAVSVESCRHDQLTYSSFYLIPPCTERTPS